MSKEATQMRSSAEISVRQHPGTSEGKWIWRTFIGISRLHITAIAAFGVFTFGWLFTGVYSWLITGVCALDWYIVNLINQTVDLKEDRTNKIPGIRFIEQNRPLLLGVSLTLLVVSLVVVHFLNAAITGLRIACHLLAAFYNWPLLPGKRRLKQLYFWKNTASALGFLITVFGYPLAAAKWGTPAHSLSPGITIQTIFFSAVFFFLFEISYEVIYDLRDVSGDAAAGIRTYPVVHGEHAAIYIIDGLIFASIAILSIGYFLDAVPWRIFVMTAAPVMQFVVYKQMLRQGRISGKDCIRITWMGVGMLAIYHLWVIAGLPGVGL